MLLNWDAAKDEDELEQAKRESAEVQAKTQAEVKAVGEKLQETKRQLKRELEEMHQSAMESERELNEIISWSECWQQIHNKHKAEAALPCITFRLTVLIFS